MSNNITQSQELAIQMAKKENRRANNLLRFFANWAEEAQFYSIDDQIACLKHMYKGFNASYLADEQERRQEVHAIYNKVLELFYSVKEAKKGVDMLPFKVSQLIKIEKIVSHD